MDITCKTGGPASAFRACPHLAPKSQRLQQFLQNSLTDFASLPHGTRRRTERLLLSASVPWRSGEGAPRGNFALRCKVSRTGGPAMGAVALTPRVAGVERDALETPPPVALHPARDRGHRLVVRRSCRRVRRTLCNSAGGQAPGHIRCRAAGVQVRRPLRALAPQERAPRSGPAAFGPVSSGNQPAVLSGGLRARAVPENAFGAAESLPRPASRQTDRRG